MVETATSASTTPSCYLIPSGTTFFSTQKTLLTALCIGFIFTVFYWQQNASIDGLLIFRQTFPSREHPKFRRVAFNLTDFGGVGDGVTLNTEAFERAILEISKLGKKGGGQLNVPPGNWLTAPFNLTSHMTLFLAKGAVILGIDVNDYLMSGFIVFHAKVFEFE